MKNIKLEDRLIFALDVPEVSDAKEIVTELDDSVNFYKIGMEMLMTGQYFELLDWLIKKDKKVFVDLKFFDVPETVGRTISRLSDYGATFATIHGNQALMEKAAENKNNLKILAVTALTSLDRGDLDDLGFSCDVQDLVISRAKRQPLVVAPSRYQAIVFGRLMSLRSDQVGSCQSRRAFDAKVRAFRAGDKFLWFGH